MKYTWDIFCDVIDNFGDIGVTWRLAKELAARQLGHVRLWVNDLASFGAMLPELGNNIRFQADGVTIELWAEPFNADVIPADYVIEAFACDLPDSYIANMANHAKAWINLEYLSAEDWVESCHGLSSGFNQVPKYFFFPGFTEKTGGLIVEQSLKLRQAQFNANQVWTRLHIPAPTDNELRLSVFTYEAQSWQPTLAALTQLARPISLIVPKGRALTSLLPLFEQQSEHHYRKGMISLYVIPFSTQEEYDELLWACDINFIRGEDSFVRAQLAGKPFIWHIYKQDEDAHIEKLQAFLDLAGAPTAINEYHIAFNRDQLIQQQATNLFNSLANWQDWASLWQEKRINCEDLVTQLVKFLNSKV
jgi:uncharacterized repeat protein (TIGR03837 family)